MPTAGWAKVVIALAAVVMAIALRLSGGSPDAAWIQPLGYAMSVVVLLLLAFDRWIWCWPFIRRFVPRPSLGGTWRVEYQTNFEARRDEIIEAYLVIRQSFSAVSVALLTDRATSASMTADLVCHKGRWSLYYLFASDKHANAPDRDTNPPARGAADLVVATTPLTHLEGDYWTERGTRGRLWTTGHTKTFFDTFRSAQSAAYRPLPQEGELPGNAL